MSTPEFNENKQTTNSLAYVIFSDDKSTLSHSKNIKACLNTGAYPLLNTNWILKYKMSTRDVFISNDEMIVKKKKKQFDKINRRHSLAQYLTVAHISYTVAQLSSDRVGIKPLSQSICDIIYN